MSLDPERQRTAEILLAKWENHRNLCDYRSRLECVAEIFDSLSEAINSELGGDDCRSVVRYAGDQGFTVSPANQEIGKKDTYDLPTAETLRQLTDGILHIHCTK